MIGRKIVDKFYLNNNNNVVFIFCIICNMALCVLSYYIKLNYMVSIIANIITIVTSLGISFNYNKPHKEELAKKELKEIDVARKSWFNEVATTDGIVFLTGESGIGKTYLLNQLMGEFDKRNISYDYEENNYFFDLQLNKMHDKEYIILDQFERALSFDNIFDNISIIKELENKKIIISMRKEYIGEIYRLFDFDESIRFVWLEYRKEELDDIEDYLQKLARGTKQSLKEHSLYSKILEDAKLNRISLIQLSCLGREIQFMDEDYVEAKMEEYAYNYDQVIMDYLTVQLDKYKYSKVAYIIMYLLCQDHNGQYINDMKDFQNVILESEDRIYETVNYLREQKWIKKVKENEEVRSEFTENYEISHDYFMMLFEKICMKQIESDIRNNIKYYSVNCQNDRRNIEEGGTWKTYTYNLCKKFIEPLNKVYLNIGLYIMMIFIVFGNIYTLVKEPQAYWMLAAINLMVGESVFYVYNYYYNFISIYKIRYIIGVIIGAISCILPYAIMNYWAVSLGFEVCVVGIIMGGITCNVREDSKPFFRARCYIFLGIGVIIFILGFFFPIYTQDKPLLACPLFALYGLYMFMGILNHINKDYILAIVGKTLYGGRRINI